MTTPARLLMLEDNAQDAELILERLAGEGIDCRAVRLESEQAFRDALARDEFDLILSDCALPGFSGLAALKIARSACPEVPFVFVSGSIGEEMAIETLKSGATDYVLKNRLGRLGAAVRRALEESRERKSRQEAERARQRAESLFRALFDQMGVGVIIFDLNHRLVMTNPAAQRMFGTSEADFLEAVLGRPEPNGHKLPWPEVHAELLGGKRLSAERQEKYVRKDGGWFWARRVVSMIRESQESCYFVNLVEDMTEHRELEQHFLQAQKMEVVGRLAAGFAHDFNNLLTIINGYSQLLLSSTNEAAPERRALLEVKRAGERAVTLTQRLLSFGRQHVERPQTLDLNAVIESLEDSMAHIAGNKIRVARRLEDGLAPIEADATQIEQVILNLVVNARDAMSDGGDLTIQTASALVEGDASRDGAGARECVVLTISDTGCGMDEATKARIFEPFFTTKPPGQGTGLGLWMVSEIVRQNRGTISVYSSPGRGTSFRLCVPKASAQAGAISALAQSVSGRGELEAVLVVCEQDNLREQILQVLEPAGYEVSSVQSEAEAQDELRTSTSLRIAVLAGAAAEISDNTLLAWAPGLRIVRMGANGQAGLCWPQPDGALLRAVRNAAGPHSATVLVADDDPALRGFVRHVLSESGFRVLEAGDGAEALTLARRHKVDLVITDLIMPDREGIETIQTFAERHPEVPLIAMSGGRGERFLEMAGKLGACAVLHKPFSADTVSNLVRRSLSRKAAGAAAGSERIKP